MSRKFLQNPYSSVSSEDRFFGSACTPHDENKRQVENQGIFMLNSRPQNPSDAIANNIPTPPNMLPDDIAVMNSLRSDSHIRKWSPVLNSEEVIKSLPKMNRPQLKTNIPRGRMRE